MNPNRARQLISGIVFVGGVITIEFSHFILHETLPPHLPEKGNHVIPLRGVAMAGITATASAAGGIASIHGFHEEYDGTIVITLKQ